MGDLAIYIIGCNITFLLCILMRYIEEKHTSTSKKLTFLLTILSWVGLLIILIYILIQHYDHYKDDNEPFCI